MRWRSELNDRHGHPAGDEALRTFGAVLRSCLVGRTIRHREAAPADLRARTGLTTEQLIYAGRAVG